MRSLRKELGGLTAYTATPEARRGHEVGEPSGCDLVFANGPLPAFIRVLKDIEGTVHVIVVADFNGSCQGGGDEQEGGDDDG